MTPPPSAPDRQNPLLSDWTGPFGLPPLPAIKSEHFRPAFDRALAAHRAEIDAISADPAAASFGNTIEALEKSGRALDRVSNVFFLLAGADTGTAIEAIEREISPLLARHSNAMYLDRALYARIAELYRRRGELGLDAEQARVLDRYHTRFVRAGGALDKPAQDRLAAINERLASLGTQFSQNVLADEKAYALILEEGDLAGLPDFARDAARAAAEGRGHAGKYAITLARSSCESFLQFSSRRDLREKIFQAWIKRGENGGATDNCTLIAEMVGLRAERAMLLGFATYADYRLDDQMAKTPQAARKLLDEVWGRARTKAAAERDALQAMITEGGGNFALAPHDWRYYAEKLRKAKYDLDEAEIKPYFQLDKMVEAAFDAAHRLFGLTFTPVSVPLYHPDTRVWEVNDKSGAHVGLFIGDYFARGSKHSGAWMTSLRDQEKLAGDIRPVILNICNFSKPAAGEKALLSFDDARTLFHEFGHALHGLLSNVTYPLLAGTSVPSDFVELPSQLYEHWLEVPEILQPYALHAHTGEPMPKALLDRLLAARTFNQGFATVEYTACALVDLDIHALPGTGKLDVSQFERDDLARIHMPAEIVMRHRLPHFQHLFSGGGYAAGYYSYMWSEVLDADAFEAFEETGNAFDPETAQRLRDFIYGAGNLRDPAEAYKAFRGRLPAVDALLKKRGLADTVPSMNLHSAGHRRGVVCAPHSAAVEDGRAILAEGGNAIEAMLAMAATIAAVYPHMNHIGGDGFWLIREPSGRVRAIMGVGRAGAKATLQFYRDAGHHEIPARGPLAALTVPGAVAGWMLALEAAKAQTGKGTHAKLPLHVLFEAAIKRAREGYSVTPSQARLTVGKYAELETVPGFIQAFLADGKAPEAGARLKQTAFAATLDHLAQAGLDDFYRGDVGREIAADLERIGSPVTRADLEKFEARIAEPLSVPIGAGTLTNTPPPTQGLASLMILALFDRLRVTQAETFEHIHGLIEATKRAFRVRDHFVTDPDQIDGNLNHFLAPKFLDAEAEKIDRKKAARWPAPDAKSDTIWMGAADASGLVVSYIQSLYWEFGSGCVLPATGVLMQNRGSSFSLDPKALNTLSPGRRPFHTLNPALAVLKDGRVIAYGTMGGDGQPQTQAAVFTRHVIFCQPIEQALDAPRWLLGRTWGSTRTNLRLESRFDGNLIDRLMAAGHDVEVLDEAYSDTMGHAGAVILHPDGTLEGGHDPRADGGAAGI